MTGQTPIKILVTPVVSKICSTLDREIEEAIDLECSLYCPGAEFVPSFQMAMWDGIRHFYSVKTKTFPTGLLSRVVSILSQKYQVEIEKKYPEPCKLNIGSLNIKLYPYQEECLLKIKENERGLIKLPTGSGKGCIISATVAEKKVPTIVLVHRKDLLYQTVKRFKKEANIEAGIIGDGKSEFKDVTVAMVQTLCRNLGIIDEWDEEDKTNIEKVKEKVLHYQMLISDEVHILGAKSCYKLTKYFKNAFYRYGFSATPLYRDEALLVEAAIGPVLYEKSIKDISGQYIADAKIVFVPFRHLPASKYLTYTDVYREKVVFNEERNKVIANLAARFKDKKTLIAVRQVEHGKVLEEMIPGAKFVYGNLSAAQRVKILNEFENGSLQTVIITCVWEQGIDIPQAEVLIDARAEKSKLAFIQLIGRVLRKTTNKHKSLIIDIADERVRWLSQHTKERIDIAIKEFGKEAVFKLKNERQN